MNALKLSEIQKMTYRSESSMAKLIVKAVADGITSSVKKGFYADTPELREWICKLANGMYDKAQVDAMAQDIKERRKLR